MMMHCFSIYGFCHSTAVNPKLGSDPVAHHRGVALIKKMIMVGQQDKRLLLDGSAGRRVATETHPPTAKLSPDSFHDVLALDLTFYVRTQRSLRTPLTQPVAFT